MGYAEWMWKHFGSKLQPMYKKIDEWEWPWMQELCADIWEKLPSGMQKELFTLISNFVSKYGADKAKELIEKLINALKEILEKND